jgi:hypothetical protein
MVQYFPIVTGSLTVTGSVNVSGSITTNSTITATTLVVQTITSSVSAVTGSTNFGSLSSNTHTFTGSVLISGSNVLIGTPTSNGFRFKVSNNGAEEWALNPGDSANINNHVNYNRNTSAYIGANYLAATHSFLQGNVGIGTTVPSFTLDVSGSGRFTSNLTTNGLYLISGNAIRTYRGANDYYWQINSDSNNFLNFGTYFANGTAYGTNPKLLLHDNGNVGIGLSSPNAALHIVSGVNTRYNTFDGPSAGYCYQDYRYNGTIYGYLGQASSIVGGGSNTDMALVSTNSLVFGTGGTIERMTITNVGQVLMNTNATVLTSGWLCIAVPSSNYNAIVLKDTGTTYSSGNYYQVYTNSNNGIAGGIIHSTASTVIFYTGPSDARLKSNIKNVEESILPLFNDIKLKTYNHIADEDESVVYKGFLAQEMVDKFPEAYVLDKEGYYMYNPDGYIPYLVKAISELTARVQELENK